MRALLYTQIKRRLENKFIPENSPLYTHIHTYLDKYLTQSPRDSRVFSRFPRFPRFPSFPEFPKFPQSSPKSPEIPQSSPTFPNFLKIKKRKRKDIINDEICTFDK